MRIMYILGIDMEKGGPSVHLLNDIIDETKKRGHEIIRIEKNYGNDTWNVKEFFNDSEKIYKVECTLPQGQNYVKRYLDDLKYVYKCWKTLRNENVDVIFLQSCNNAAFQCFWLRKCLNKPILYNVQDIFPLDIYYEGIMSKKNLIYMFFDILQKYAYKCSTKIVTISKDMEKTLLQLGIEKTKLSLVYNWAYEDEYSEKYENEIKERFYSNKLFHVVYAGNVGTAQGVEILIESCKYLKEYRDIEILIFGSGSRLKKCRKIASELKLKNIKFYDLVPQHLAKYIYNGADINIVTLVPGVINTSMPSKTAACYKSNKPVIYCVDNDSETIRLLRSASKSIYSCSPGDAKALAKKIIEVYKNKDILNKNIRIPYETVMKPQKAEAYVNIIEGLK